MAVTNNVSKRFVLKIYDPTTGAVKLTLSDKYFSSKPEYSIEINGGLSKMKLMVAQELNEFMQSSGKFFSAPLIGDRVKLFVYDKEDPNGKQMYSGIYSGVELNLIEKKWSFTFTFLPNTLYLAKKVLRNDAGKTTVTYSSNDPADIIKNIVFLADTIITYAPHTIRDTSLSRTYEFITYYALEAIKKVAEMLPRGWFFYIGVDDYVYLKNHDMNDPESSLWGVIRWDEDYWDYDPINDSTPTHELYSGTAISTGQIRKDMINMTNRVVFVGGDIGGGVRLFKEFNRESSQTYYGLFEELAVDERVTSETTARQISNRILDSQSIFQTNGTIKVLDSNFTKHGYDIEKFRPGDKILIKTDQADSGYNKWGSFTWGLYYWKYNPYSLTAIPYIIKKINYKWDHVVLDVDLHPEQQTMRVEDINRDLSNYRLKDIPDEPT